MEKKAKLVNSQGQEIRSDATANRKQLVLAAQKLFSARGVDIPISEIAAEAGVTRMTLHRHFPDRQAIAIAVVHYNVGLLENYAKKIEGGKGIFYKLVAFILKQQVEFHALMPLMPTSETDLAVRLFSIFKNPVREAKADSSLRSDFNLQKDLLLLIAMLGGALVNPFNMNRTARAKRALDLLTEGLKKS